MGKVPASLDMQARGLCIRLLKEALLALGSPLRVEELVALLVGIPVSLPPLQLLCSRSTPAAQAHVLERHSRRHQDSFCCPFSLMTVSSA